MVNIGKKYAKADHLSTNALFASRNNKVTVSFGDSTSPMVFSKQLDTRILTQYSHVAKDQVNVLLQQNPSPTALTVHYPTKDISVMHRLGLAAVLKWLEAGNFPPNGFPSTYKGHPQMGTDWVTKFENGAFQKDESSQMSFEFGLHVYASILLVGLTGPLKTQLSLRSALIKYINSRALTPVELHKVWHLFTNNPASEDPKFVERALHKTVDYIDEAREKGESVEELDLACQSIPAMQSKLDQIRQGKKNRKEAENRKAELEAKHEAARARKQKARKIMVKETAKRVDAAGGHRALSEDEVEKIKTKTAQIFAVSE
jgi:hypothetical protein